jgi:hypothetical protein
VNCHRSATHVRVDLTAQGQSGDLEILLFDPTGAERLRETLRKGDRNTALQWPAAVGAWQLQLTTTEFWGSYSAKLCAADEPITVWIELVNQLPEDES